VWLGHRLNKYSGSLSTVGCHRSCVFISVSDFLAQSWWRACFFVRNSLDPHRFCCVVSLEYKPGMLVLNFLACREYGSFCPVSGKFATHSYIKFVHQSFAAEFQESLKLCFDCSSNPLPFRLLLCRWRPLFTRPLPATAWFSFAEPLVYCCKIRMRCVDLFCVLRCNSSFGAFWTPLRFPNFLNCT